MRINSNHLEKFEALVATGMPGAYKVLIFFLLQELYGLSLLGNIASWQSIAQIFGFFTAIGWCSLILVRVAKAESEQDRINNFNSLLLMGLFTLGFFCVGILLAGEVVGEQEQAVEVAVWLCAWTAYQIPRHYLIAQKKYRHALLLDCAIILSSVLCLLALSAELISLALACCMLIAGMFAIIIFQKRNYRKTLVLGFDSKGIEYGFINLLSGGIYLSLVPLASYFAGKDFAGIVSLYIAVSGVALLIPRAIAINQLPRVAQAVAKSGELKALSVSMQKQITMSNLSTTALCALIAFLFFYMHQSLLSPWQTGVALLLITLQGTAGTQALVDANILMAKEMSREILAINFISFLVFLFMALVVFVVRPNYSYTYVCVVVLVVSIYRLVALRKQAVVAVLYKDSCRE